ncbi:MAG: LysR family transcriptional regulator [Uliginosibacterium sp.]|nr:LysR family transcriptional regulator [Uliginosibacterium sp.]
MTLQQLRDFVASVEHGSLRRAAHAEGKSEASLSKSIKRLESFRWNRVAAAAALSVYR